MSIVFISFSFFLLQLLFSIPAPSMGSFILSHMHVPTKFPIHMCSSYMHGFKAGQLGLSSSLKKLIPTHFLFLLHAGWSSGAAIMCSLFRQPRCCDFMVASPPCIKDTVPQWASWFWVFKSFCPLSIIFPEP